jgi:AcrR family transcriptional regulator
MGRPRAVDGPGGDDPRAEILDASADLFTRVGYTRTTTRQIAEAVGLRQGSLFHYFARKKDILDELLNSTINPALAIARWLEGLEASADVKLFLLVKHDATNLCSRPHNLGTLYFQPEIKSEEFAAHWENRDRLRSIYRELIADAAQAHRFEATDVELATDAIFGLVESTCTWYDRDGGRDASAVGDSVARYALQMLLHPGGDLKEVWAAADALGGPPPTETSSS